MKSFTYERARSPKQAAAATARTAGAKFTAALTSKGAVLRTMLSAFVTYSSREQFADGIAVARNGMVGINIRSWDASTLS